MFMKMKTKKVKKVWKIMKENMIEILYIVSVDIE